MSEFHIGEHALWTKRPPYVVAEVGLNHNGDLAFAKKSIREAAACGADAVKFQTFRADEFIADRNLTYTYLKEGKPITENAFTMFERLELPRAWHSELMYYCETLGVRFLSSAADPASADFLVELGVGAIKLASEDLINGPLLRHVGALGCPVILSTGMADEAEVDEAVEALSSAGCRELLLLHCVSVYPTPDPEANLLRLVGLRERYGLPVGYSDHSLGITASIGAVALGALMIEKHFTLDRTLSGPDHSLSSDPQELAALVTEVRRIWQMAGSKDIAPSATELTTRQDFRRSIRLSRDVEAGAQIALEFLCLKRPATGLHPRHLSEVVGRRARTKLRVNQPLRWNDLE